MRQKAKIAVYGSGGHALAVFDAAAAAGFLPHAVVDPFADAPEVFGLPVFTSLERLNLNTTHLCLGVGANFDRETLYNFIQKHYPSARFPVISHPSASISPSAEVAAGAILMAQSNLGPGSSVGVGSIVNSAASLDHEAILGNFGSLSPGVVTGGRARIGDRSMIGIGAAILQGVAIGADSVIGAMAMVKDDVPAFSVAYGNPCKFIRTRAREEPYF